MNTFNLGEFMVEIVISNLKSGASTGTTAILYVSNYCIKGWITDERMQEVLIRITAIANGQPDPEEETAIDEIPILTEDDFVEDDAANVQTGDANTDNDVTEETEVEPEEESNVEDTTESEETTNDGVSEETEPTTEESGEETEGGTGEQPTDNSNE